jgi:hypothetical protein
MLVIGDDGMRLASGHLLQPARTALREFKGEPTESLRMLRPSYLSQKLTSPIPTRDGGTLHTIQEAWEYMAAISKEREQRRHWQQVRKMILDEEANMAAVSWQLRLAVLKDAKLDVTKMGT